MIIVVFCLVDYVLYLVVATYNGFPGAKVLRLAKLFRVIRSLRAVRILRTIRWSFTYSLCCRQVCLITSAKEVMFSSFFDCLSRPA